MAEFKIGDKAYKMAFTMRTAIAYEHTTNQNALDLTQYQDGKIGNLIALGYCMMVTSNNPEEVPMYEEYEASITSIEVLNELVGVVSQELMKFFRITEADKKGQKAPTEEEPKNA